MGNCVQRQSRRERNQRKALRDSLLRDKDEIGMIYFYEEESAELVESVESVESLYATQYDIRVPTKPTKPTKLTKQTASLA